MARFRSRMALRPIQRIKHVVDASGTIAAGGNFTQALIDTVDATAIADTDGVLTGSTVNAIYLRVECASNDAIVPGAIPNVYMYVAKNPGNNLVLPNANAVGSNDNKRFVIHQEMSMIENKGQGSNPRTLFNGVIVIPKGYRRFGPDDQLTFKFHPPALDCAICIQCHYKEFR